jgi:hypothetical protein
LTRIIHAAIAAIILIVILIAAYLAFFNAKAATPEKVSFSQSFCINEVSNTQAMNFAISSGVNCFRTDLFLNKTEEEMIANQSERGVEYLGILDYDTLGARPSQSGCISDCNWTLAEWNASVSDALAAYPEVHQWEIWNEPLVTNYMSGYENGSALDYFNMIKSAYQIIKSKDPNDTVVCFGGAELFPFTEVEYEYPFYHAVWNYGASKYCDAISIHVYSLPFYNLNQNFASNATLAEEYNYTLLLYENLTHKPVWITETGITSNNWTAGLDLSEQKQASFLKQEFDFFSSYPFVQRVYWFNLLGSGGNTPDYGLLNETTLQPKPSWYSFLYFVKNSTASR